MRYFLFFSVMIYSFLLRGQEEESSYKEDQFFLSATYLNVRHDIPEFTQFGFSHSFQLGYINDISLSSNGQRALGIGLGYGYDYIISNLTVENSIDASVFSLTSSTMLSSKNRLSRHYITLPVEFRWRTSTLEQHDFWRIYGGYKLNYQFLNRIDPFYGRPKNIKNNINPFQHSLSLAMGYDTWNIYFEYGFSSFFSKSTRTQEDVPLELSALKFGLIFYLL